MYKTPFFKANQKFQHQNKISYGKNDLKKFIKNSLEN